MRKLLDKAKRKAEEKVRRGLHSSADATGEGEKAERETSGPGVERESQN